MFTSVLKPFSSASSPVRLTYIAPPSVFSQFDELALVRFIWVIFTTMLSPVMLKILAWLFPSMIFPLPVKLMDLVNGIPLI